MLYYKLNGYEDFKQRFGLEGRGNGTTVRKNKILLGHLKSPLLLSYCVKQNDYSLLHVDDMADLQKKIVEAVRKSGTEDAALSHEVELIGEVYRSAKYRTDESKGVCEDQDKGSVRYVNVERDRVFKMKSGKFMRELILETRIGKLFSPSVLNWLSPSSGVLIPTGTLRRGSNCMWTTISGEFTAAANAGATSAHA